MGEVDVSVTDKEGWSFIQRTFGELDARFLDNPNPGENKKYFEAIWQIIRQIDPKDVEVKL